MLNKPKKRKNALQRHLSAIGKKGAEATLQRHGREHYVRLAEKRWGNKKKNNASK